MSVASKFVNLGTVKVGALGFFVMFSTPSTGRKDIARTNQPNLGLGSGVENTDTSYSVTPLWDGHFFGKA
jgi:hypothetical protein